MVCGALPFESREFVRCLRQNYVNHHKLWTKVECAVAEGVELLAPGEVPTTEEDFPQQLRALLAAYKQSHPKEDVSFIKKMRIVDDKPVTVLEDESPLPEEDHLMCLSIIVMLNASDFAHVVTDVFVARRG